MEKMMLNLWNIAKKLAMERLGTLIHIDKKLALCKLAFLRCYNARVN
jgi:hypothetical protein